MIRRRIATWSAVLTLLAATPVLAQKAKMQDAEIRKQLADSIESVRLASTSNSRDDAAQRLEKLTRKISAKEIDDKTIAGMVELLDLPDARYWVAVSLGNIGRRASVAIPKLQKLLADEDGRRVEMSAAGGIRYALRRMGVQPPPPPWDH